MFAYIHATQKSNFTPTLATAYIHTHIHVPTCGPADRARALRSGDSGEASRDRQTRPDDFGAGRRDGSHANDRSASKWLSMELNTQRAGNAGCVECAIAAASDDCVRPKHGRPRSFDQNHARAYMRAHTRTHTHTRTQAASLAERDEEISDLNQDVKRLQAQIDKLQQVPMNEGALGFRV